MSAALAAIAAAYAARQPRLPIIQPSRLIDGVPPHAASCCKGSRKSGPTLKGCTRSPEACIALMIPTATVVLPTPDDVPATTIVGVDEQVGSSIGSEAEDRRGRVRRDDTLATASSPT